MLSKSPSRPKSETVIGGGLCPDTWATAFNDSYVGTCRSCAFGQKRSPLAFAQLDRSSHIKVEFALNGLGEFYNVQLRTAK